MGLRRPRRYVRHGCRPGVPRPCAQPGASGHARFARERRHLLPASRVLQRPLRRAPGDSRELHAAGQRQDRHELRPLQLLWRAGCRPRHRGHGLHLRRGRRGRRLPERARREGRSGEGPPVSPVRARETGRCHPRDGHQGRRHGPHQGARQRRRASVPGRRLRSP